MVGFEVILHNVKLNGREFYTKIQIWPYLGRITMLNHIIRNKDISVLKNKPRVYVVF
jgi:hypothetical protein